MYNWNDSGLKKNQDEEFIVLISEVTGGGGVVDWTTEDSIVD